MSHADKHKRHHDAIRQHTVKAAKMAGIDAPDEAAIDHDLASPRAVAVLDLLDEAHDVKSRGVATPPSSDLQTKGNALLRGHVAASLAFAEHVLDEVKAAGMKADPFAVGWRDALKGLLARFK